MGKLGALPCEIVELGAGAKLGSGDFPAWRGRLPHRRKRNGEWLQQVPWPSQPFLTRPLFDCQIQIITVLRVDLQRPSFHPMPPLRHRVWN